MADKTFTNDTTTASNTQATTTTPLIRPIGEVHDELIAEADKQEAFNREQHRIQAEEANRFNNLNSGYVVPSPDDARAEALDRQKAEAALTSAGTTDASVAKGTPKATGKPSTPTQTGQN